MINFNIDFKKPLLRSIFTTTCAIWFEKDLSEKFQDVQVKIPIEIDFNSTSKTIEWLKKLNISWLVYPKEIVTALNYNHCWLSVRYKRRIIGCIKIGFGYVYITDYDKVVKLPDKMAFIYDTYVLKEMRRKGVAKFLIIQALKFVKTKGYSKVGCHIPPWNKSSINAYEKIGFKKINYIRNFNFFGFSLRILKSPKNYSIFTKFKIQKEDLPF